MRRAPLGGALTATLRNPASLQPQMQTQDKPGALVLETVKIEVLLSGQPYQTLVDATENDGSFNWGIPDAFPAGTDYRIRISSVDSPEVTYNSGKFSITNPADIAAPTNLKTDPYQETPVGSLRYSVKISWKDKSNNETGFRIERMDTVSTAWKVVKTVSANTTSYTDTGLLGDRSYSYRVYAYNQDGNSGNSNQVAVPIVDPPTNLVVASLVGPEAYLTWKDNSSLETGFIIERKIDSGGWVVFDSVGANATTYWDRSVASPHTYSYRIRAFTDVFGDTVFSGYSATGSVTFY
jgi:titin